MNWEQIEENWSAMTRRVRPDWTSVSSCEAAFGGSSDGAEIPAEGPAVTRAEDRGPVTGEVG